MILSWISTQLALIVGIVVTIAAVAHMLRRRRSPSATVAWLLLFVGMPYLGVALYLMFGGRKVRRDAMLKESPKLSEAGTIPLSAATPLDCMLRNYGVAGATSGNRMTLLTNAGEGYRGLRRLIEEASRTFYLTTYLFGRDEVGRDILRQLVGKAQAGVDVRLLVDGVGSLGLGRRFLRPLADAGGRVAVFKPVIHFPFRGRTNLRNHRKIAVADGRIAMAGGMNITAEDMSPQPTGATWRDLSFLVEGPAAAHYQEIFRCDWQFASGETPPPPIPPPPSNLPSQAAGHNGAVLQVVPSGPDVPNDPLYAATLEATYTAAERLWIVTPYFIPNDMLMEALEIACRRGVDVRILVPERSNHPLSDLARAGFLRQLQQSGASVLLHPGGMVHAKVMLVDDRLAMVGSANLDMRSLFLNYEVMQFGYSPREVRAIERWAVALMRDARCGMGRAGPWREITEGLVRMVSPLF